MMLAGADDSFNVYGRVSRTKIATVSISNNLLMITAQSGVSDGTKPIGIVNKTNGQEIMNYFTIEVFNGSASTSTFQEVQIDSTINTLVGGGPIAPLTILSIGMMQSPYSIAIPNQTLDGKVDNLGQALLIRNYVPTGPFKFYAMFSDNSIQFYEIAYLEQDIYTSDLTRIPVIAVTTKLFPVPEFLDPNVQVINGVINNNTTPTSHVLIMTKPKYVKLLLNTL